MRLALSLRWGAIQGRLLWLPRLVQSPRVAGVAREALARPPFGRPSFNRETLATRRLVCASASSPASDLVEMEVTRHNFAEVLPKVKQALEECQYFSLDCEFTGLFLEDRNGSYLDDMEDRYEEMVRSAGSFVITQYGLSAFVWENGAYRPRTFNFYVFPRPFEGQDKRFVCQASSLDFLAKCGFDFNKTIHDGISYSTIALRDRRLAGVDREASRERQEVLVTKPEDVAFVRQTVEAITGWLQGTEPELDLPPANAYQRLLQWQELRRPQFGAADPPGFYVQKVQGEGGWPSLRLTRAGSAEVAAWEAEQRRKHIDAIHEAAGFAAVFQAMRDCGKPAVVHNGAFDLAYSLHSFAQELPGTWAEYKSLLARCFPGGVYDTKLLAAQFPGVFEDTSLGVIHDGMLKGQLSEQLEAFLRQAAEAAMAEGSSDGELAELPAVEHARGFERYKGVDTQAYAHEAGYDAFMTGAAFACLCRLFGAQGGAAPAEQQVQLAAVEGFKWRINISRSDMPYVALQGPDPQPDRSHVFYLTGWEQGQRVLGGEIARKLADSGLGQLRATIVEQGQGALVEVGDQEAVPGALDVLREKLPGWTVQRYDAYQQKRQAQRLAAAAAAEAAAAARRGNRNGGGGSGGGGGGSHKRPRVELESRAGAGAGAGAAAEGTPEQEGGRWCRIM